MLLYFFIALGIVSAGGLGLIGWRQLKLVRGADALPADFDLDLREVLQVKIDSLYRRFNLFFRRLLRSGYLYSLLGLHRFVLVARFLLTRVERKFSRLIDSVHGRGTLTIKSSAPASPFLARMKER